MSLSRQVACRGYAEASAHPADRSEETTGPPAAAETSAVPPLRSVRTANFPALLDQLGISLLVTTYQAGKLVVLRADQDHVNTHFRNLNLLMDVTTNAVLLRGLSMPHSPRWYAGRLWVLESGAGGVGFVDPRSGSYVGLAELPGFTRGLDFCGPLAFIGLSQVRESAVFSGIPITERLAEHERTCGVCAVDLTSGQVVALLRFETAVQEVFAVTVLPGRRYPDLINDDDKLLENSFVVPDAALADVPAALRAPAEPTLGAAGSAGNGSAPRERS